MSVEKRCVVIGGAGFIGSELVDQLTRTGRSLTVVGRRARSLATLPEACSYQRGDFGVPGILEKCLQPGCEIVVLASFQVIARYQAFEILRKL